MCFRKMALSDVPKLFLLILIFNLIAFTQAEEYQLRGKNEFSVWGGFSPDTTTALNIGTSVDARYVTTGFRYARRFDNGDKVNLKYTADIIPFSNLSFLRTEAVQIAPNGFQLQTVRHNSSAFGFVPLGIQANFRPKKRIKPFANAGGGILFFNDSIPNDLGRKTNFIVEVGGGLEVGLKNNKAITFGYKLTHISNAYRGQINPGYDNNLFYFGYTFFSK